MSKVKKLTLALTTVLALGIVVTASASAAPVWEEESFGVWSEIKVKAKYLGTELVTFLDEGTGLEMECQGPNGGTVGPGGADEVTSVLFFCVVFKGTCPSANVTPANLPWKTKLVLAGSEVRDEIENGGKGEPGWNIVCGGVVADTCTGKTSAAMSNFPGTGKVEALYDAKSAKTNCSAGGTGKGRVLGFNIISLENGKNLRIK